MDEEKVYYPETITETPFPLQEGDAVPALSPVVSGSGDARTTAPPTVKTKQFPQHLIAHETISQAINTKSRRILKDFELVDSGALRVGKFQSGVSGEMAITPAGLTALNKAGIRTLAIDAETGDVVIIGEFQGGSININNQFEVDSEGNAIARSLALVESDFTNAAGTGTNDISATSYTDISNTSRTLVIARPTIVLYFADVHAQIIQSPSAAGDWAASGIVRWQRVKQDNGVTTQIGSCIFQGERVGTIERGARLRTTAPLHYMEVLQAGTYTINCVAKLESTSNNGILRVNDIISTIMTLGTWI